MHVILNSFQEKVFQQVWMKWRRPKHKGLRKNRMKKVDSRSIFRMKIPPKRLYFLFFWCTKDIYFLFFQSQSFRGKHQWNLQGDKTLTAKYLWSIDK